MSTYLKENGCSVLIFDFLTRLRSINCLVFIKNKLSEILTSKQCIKDSTDQLAYPNYLKVRQFMRY